MNKYLTAMIYHIKEDTIFQISYISDYKVYKDKNQPTFLTYIPIFIAL